MARNVWREMKRLTDRVDQHDDDIRDLKGAVAMEKAILRDQRQRVALLAKLSANHSRGITRMEHALGRLWRKARHRPRRKYGDV